MSDRTLRVAMLTLVSLALLPAGGAAQDWRDMTSFRQLGDVARLDVHVRYGAGTLEIGPSAAGELYRLGLRYDSEIFDPVAQYREGSLEVGVEGRGDGINLRSRQSGEMRLSLSPDIPLDLDLDFGAVEAELELGGLHVERISVETGASDTRLGFSEPNTATCDRIEITMGAAALTATGLANANCRLVEAEGGVGDLTLDFTGEWRQDMHADLTMALGSVTLVVPENVGVRVQKSTFLTNFDSPRFHKRGGTHYSESWDRAEHKLTIDLEGAFGSMKVRWAAPSGTP